MRFITPIAILLLFGLALHASAENPAVGKWACTSTAENGMKVDWTLIVKADGGKLSASAIFAQTGDEVALRDVTLDGNNLSFKLQINPEEIVQLTGKIDGHNLEGTFQGKASGTGTLKGTKQD